MEELQAEHERILAALDSDPDNTEQLKALVAIDRNIRAEQDRLARLRPPRRSVSGTSGSDQFGSVDEAEPESDALSPVVSWLKSQPSPTTILAAAGAAARGNGDGDVGGGGGGGGGGAPQAAHAFDAAGPRCSECGKGGGCGPLDENGDHYCVECWAAFNEETRDDDGGGADISGEPKLVPTPEPEHHLGQEPEPDPKSSDGAGPRPASLRDALMRFGDESERRERASEALGTVPAAGSDRADGFPRQYVAVAAAGITPHFAIGPYPVVIQTLRPGEDVEVLQLRAGGAGTGMLRVRTRRGWVSLFNAAGKPLLMDKAELAAVQEEAASRADRAEADANSAARQIQANWRGQQHRRHYSQHVIDRVRASSSPDKPRPAALSVDNDGMRCSEDSGGAQSPDARAVPLDDFVMRQMDAVLRRLSELEESEQAAAAQAAQSAARAAQAAEQKVREAEDRVSILEAQLRKTNAALAVITSTADTAQAGITRVRHLAQQHFVTRLRRQARWRLASAGFDAWRLACDAGQRLKLILVLAATRIGRRFPLRLCLGRWAGAARAAARARQLAAAAADRKAEAERALAMRTELDTLRWTAAVAKLRKAFVWGVTLQLLRAVFSAWRGRQARAAQQRLQVARGARRLQRRQLAACFGRLAGEARRAARGHAHDRAAALHAGLGEQVPALQRRCEELQEQLAAAEARNANAVETMARRQTDVFEAWAGKERSRGVQQLLARVAWRVRTELLCDCFARWVRERPTFMRFHLPIRHVLAVPFHLSFHLSFHLPLPRAVCSCCHHSGLARGRSQAADAAAGAGSETDAWVHTALVLRPMGRGTAASP
eukprot:SAG22_NODE_334_length_12094_cov_9.446019_4_plen_833_part_00